MESNNESNLIQESVLNSMREIMAKINSPRLFANTVCRVLNELLSSAGIEFSIQTHHHTDCDKLNSVGLHEIISFDERQSARSDSVSASIIHRFVSKERSEPPNISRVSALVKGTDSDAIPGPDQTLRQLLNVFPDLHNKLGRINLNTSCFRSTDHPVYTATPDGIIKTSFMWIPVEVYEYSPKPKEETQRKLAAKPKKDIRRSDTDEEPMKIEPKSKTQDKRDRLARLHSKQESSRARKKEDPDLDVSDFKSESDDNYAPSKEPKPKVTQLGKRRKTTESKEPFVLVGYSDHSADAANKRQLAVLAKKTLVESPIDIHYAEKVKQIRAAMMCTNSSMGLLIRVTERDVIYTICYQTFDFLCKASEREPTARKLIAVANELNQDQAHHILNSKVDRNQRREVLSDVMSRVSGSNRA